MAQVALVYEHIQSSPSATWVITHNLGYQPASDVWISYQGGIQKVLPLSVVHTDENTLTVTFNTARTGGARLV